jgi:hypothetical protein
MDLIKSLAAVGLTISSLMLVQSSDGLNASSRHKNNYKSTPIIQEISRAVSRISEESSRALGRSDLEGKVLALLNSSTSLALQSNGNGLASQGIQQVICGDTRIVPTTNITLCYTQELDAASLEEYYLGFANYFVTILESYGTSTLNPKVSKRNADVYRQPITIHIFDKTGDGVSQGDFVIANWYNNSGLHGTGKQVSYHLNYSSPASEQWRVADCNGQNLTIRQGSLSLIKTASAFSTFVKIITLSTIDFKQKKIDELNSNYALLISQDSPPSLSGELAVKSINLGYEKIVDIYNDKPALARMRSCR